MAGKDRKKQIARQRYERQQQRRAAQAARARRLRIAGSAAAVVVVAAGAVGIATVAGGDDGAKDGQNAATPSQPPSPTVKPGECAYQTDQPSGSENVGVPPVKPAYKGAVRATIKTNLGEIDIELDGKKAPCTVNSFAHLASKNFFDKTDCHRLTTGKVRVLQCGDPTGKGTGGPGYRFANEGTGDPAKMKTFTKASVAMAHSPQKDSNGSQFFIVYGDSDFPDDYTMFGKITSGIDVVEKVGHAGSEPKGDGKPKKGITLQDVSIAKK